MKSLVATLVLIVTSGSALAKPEFLAPAIAFGAKDCLFCHLEPGGGREWNARGHWLLAEKQRRNSELVDTAWLSGYTPSPESEGLSEAPATVAQDDRNIPETLHRGPFFQPNESAEALARWIESRGSYTTAEGEWPQYAGDIAASKYAPLDRIDESNVADLEVAWVWDAFDNSNYIDPDADPSKPPSPAARRRFPDGFKASPLMVDGKLYIRTNFSGVAAIDPASGETLWTYDPGTVKWGRPGIFGFATRGLGYWSDGTESRILLCTGDSYLVALDPGTGEPIQSFGDNGRTDLTQGSRRPLIRRLVNCSAPPTIIGNVAVVGNQIADGPPGRGERSGGSKWKENWPVGDVRGYDVRTGKRIWTFHTVPQEGEFGNDTWEGDSWKWMGNTNVWSMMSADEELGYVYLPVTSPTFNFAGGFRGGDNLFSNSIVCLNAKTGERVWHFQTIRHDVWDWDLPAAPNLIDIEVEGRKIPALVQVTKTGFLYVFDRRTGEPVWPIEDRPVPSSEFESVAETQPFPTKPPPFEMQGISEDALIDFTPELRAQALAAVKPYRLGPLFTPPSKQGTIQVPGWGGGANWGGAGYDPETGYLFLSSRRQYIVVGMQPVEDPATRGYEYEHKFYQVGIGGLPVVKPPYGTLTAYDMNRGEIAWQTPHGSGPRERGAFKGLGLPPLGNPNAAGVLVTRTLLFAGDRGDRSEPAYIRAYDKATGETLWEHELPGRHHNAPPITYLANGEQFVVIGVGGATEPARLVAFRLRGR